jgi:propanol-preferring alcohol dehydrogenase
VGTEKEMEELLLKAADGKVDPSLEIVEFDEVPSVFERLVQNSITGRVVVRIPE